ncbi:deubiquitinase DESI2-like isoform X2 [Epargyreus clarus]
MKRCDACRNRSDRGVREARPGDDRDPLINSPTILQEEPYDNRTLSCGICTMFPSCMSLLPRRSEPRAPRPGQAPVVLNVYDMYWTNWYTAGAGVGVFHSGVQVHGSEWAYGGHPYAFTGVFEITPRDERELGEQFRFRQSVHIGYTDFSEEEVRRLVTELGKQFRGDRYHLMNNNCNHFTSAFCLALCSRDIPAWVNRLAYVSSCVPFLQRCLPKEWLTPAALQQSLAGHSRSASPASRASPATPTAPALPH